jgi:pyridoxine 5-phosphate synthase
MTDLSVNLNAVAHLRNRRDLPWPSVTGIARICLAAGADGLTVHPRPDERHIRRTDVFEVSDLLRDEWQDREYNVEGYPDEAFLKLCEVVRPDQVTLVPDTITQATSDHGWDIAAHSDFLATVTRRLKAGGMRVSIFIDPNPEVPMAAAEVGADRVEMFTGPYGHPGANTAAELKHLIETSARYGMRSTSNGRLATVRS